MGANRYVPRCRNELRTIFNRHFVHFCEHYAEMYAATYGIYRLERIPQMGERFGTYGDHLQGVARIRCANPECGLVGAVGTLPQLSPRHPADRRTCPVALNRDFLICLRLPDTQKIPAGDLLNYSGVRNNLRSSSRLV